MELIQTKNLKLELRRGVYLRLFDIFTFEIGWFNQEPMFLGVELLKLGDNGGFVNTFFFTIIRIQIVKLSLSLHISGGAYNA